MIVQLQHTTFLQFIFVLLWSPYGSARDLAIRQRSYTRNMCMQTEGRGFQPHINNLEHRLNDYTYPGQVNSGICNHTNIQPNDPTHELSLCPWQYQLNTDIDRYPQMIRYAVCTCSTCRSDNDISDCKMVYHQHSVIRRYCENGRFRYVNTQESWPIACVCSRRVRNNIG